MDTRLLTVWHTFIGSVVQNRKEYVTEFGNLPEGWSALFAVLIGVALLASAVHMYLREGRSGISLRKRILPAALRCCALTILMFILLDPARVRILRHRVDSYTVLLVDNSPSMDLNDTYRAPADAARIRSAFEGELEPPLRRSDIVHRLLNRDNRAFLAGLARNNHVRLLTFNDEVEHRGEVAAAVEDPADRNEAVSGAALSSSVQDAETRFDMSGSATNIDLGIRRAIEVVGGAPLAGIVVLSDGGFNDGAPVEEAARRARDRGVPIHVVGIGDPTAPRNIRVTDIIAPDTTLTRDPFAITARITAHGFEGQSLRVRLHQKAPDDSHSRFVADQEVTVQPDGSIDPVTFQRSQEQAAPLLFSVEVPVRESEAITSDNRKQATVNVVDSRTRVLVVAGGPSWDYRFVTRLLERDAGVDVTCWLQSADRDAVRDGNVVVDHLPQAPEELLEFDVIILMDADPTNLTEFWCESVHSLVTQHGGGLLMTAARPHTSELVRAPVFEPLRGILPVVLDPQADLIQSRIGHYQLSPSPIEVPTSALSHPIMRLADDPAANRQTWNDFGEVYWHYPALRGKPAATVLMRHGSPRMRGPDGGHVLAAVQYVGSGRAGFLAFDGTWRWRQYAEDKYNRFWVQLVRHLAEGRLLGQARGGVVLTDRDRYAPGDTVNVSARLLNKQYEPLAADRVRAIASMEGEDREFSLEARSAEPGWFEGSFTADRVGTFRVEVRTAAADDQPAIACDVVVSRPNLEMLRPQMNRSALSVLAEQSAGGRYFDVDEARELPAAIPDLHEEVSVRSDVDPLWDSWTVLGVLFALLCAEWGIRKWSNLL